MPTSEDSVVRQLLDEARENMLLNNYDFCLQLLDKAYSLDNNNTETLDFYAEIYFEVGQMEKAQQYIQRSIELEPNSHYMKWMYLGQLKEGSNALLCYQKGIEILEYFITNTTDEDELDTYYSQLSAAYASITEIYMTDLCDQPDAEQQTQFYINKAVSVPRYNIEGYILSIQYYIIKDNVDEAKKIINNISPLLSDNNNMEYILYESRFKLGKLCCNINEYAISNIVLEGLLNEDDSDPEIWYFISLNYHFLNNNILALEYVDKCISILNELITETQDEKLLSHLNEATKLKQEIIQSGNDGNNNGGNQ